MQIGLGVRQILVLAVLGIALCYGAGLLLHWLAVDGRLQGRFRTVIYALTIPGTLPFVYVAACVSGLRPDQRLTGIAVVTTSNGCGGIACNASIACVIRAAMASRTAPTSSALSLK